MRRPRFSLAELMAIVLYFGFGFAALRNANVFWASATYTLAIMMVAAALVGALARKAGARTAWIGFAVFGGAYLLVSRLPGLNTPTVGLQGGPYLLIEWGIAQLAPYLYPPGTGRNWAEYDQVSHSLGIILFGLVGAVLGRFLAVKGEPPNP